MSTTVIPGTANVDFNNAELVAAIEALRTSALLSHDPAQRHDQIILHAAVVRVMSLDAKLAYNLPRAESLTDFSDDQFDGLKCFTLQTELNDLCSALSDACSAVDQVADMPRRVLLSELLHFFAIRIDEVELALAGLSYPLLRPYLATGAYNLDAVESPELVERRMALIASASLVVEDADIVHARRLLYINALRYTIVYHRAVSDLRARPNPACLPTALPTLRLPSSN
jgi:hypothetical protein